VWRRVGENDTGGWFKGVFVLVVLDVGGEIGEHNVLVHINII